MANSDAAPPLDKLIQHIRRQFSQDAPQLPPSPTASLLGRQLATYAPHQDVVSCLLSCCAPVRCACLEALESRILERSSNEDTVPSSFDYLTNWCIALQHTPDGACFRTFAVYCVQLNPMAVVTLWEQTEHRSILLRSVLHAAFAGGGTPPTTHSITPLMACCCSQRREYAAEAVRLLHQYIWEVLGDDEAQQNGESSEDWIQWEWTLFDLCSTKDDTEWLVNLLYLTPEPSTRALRAISRTLEYVLPRHHSAVVQAALQLEQQQQPRTAPLLVLPVSAMDIFKLCAHCLTTSIATCRLGLLQVLRTGIAKTTTQETRFSQYLLQLTTELIASYDGECRLAAARIMNEVTASITLEANDVESFVGFALDRLAVGVDWNPLQQTAALLIGMAAWDCGEPDYLEKHLLPTYSHLGSVLVPLLLHRLHRRPTLPTLDLLLTSPLISNPVAAQHVWSVVSTWEDQSSALAVILLRRLPLMIHRNARLYRRCIETIGRSLASGRDPEVRLSAAASLAECAALDVIRDVSDGVIGWVQALLSPDEEPALIHYAVMTLYSLVLEEELDFNVVITVLQKKLTSLDVVALRKLPDLVLEAIAVLLSAGDVDEEDEEVVVSAQVSIAIRALLSLGQQLEFRPTDDQNVRVHRAIVSSLSNYPLAAMGVDGDSIEEAATGDELKENFYTELQRFVLLSLERLEDCSDAATLSSAILLLEEEVLGAALWQRRRQFKAESTVRKQILPQKETVRSMVMAEPTNPIAVLAYSDGDQLAVLRDNADACLEASASEPHVQVLCLEAFLAFSHKVVASRESISEAVEEIRSWYELFLSPDAMHLALASIAIYVSLRETEENDVVKDIHESVMRAFDDEDFENDEIGKICLGFLGVSSLNKDLFDQTENLVGSLEDTARGYGGEPSFGAFYALGLIAKNCLGYLERGKKEGTDQNEVKNLIYRINGFLLEQLLSCFQDQNDGSRLIDCVKSGKVSADLVDDLRRLDSNSIPMLMTKHVVARYLFMALSISSGSLAHLNGHLMMLIFRFLESLEWGTGKGLLVPSIVRTCQSSGLLGGDVLEQVYLDLIGLFERNLDATADTEGCDALEDIACAIRGLGWIVPQDKRFDLPSVPDLFADDSHALFLLSSLSTSFSFPLLGPFAHQVEPSFASGLSESDVIKSVEEVLAVANAQSATKSSSIALIALSLLSCAKQDGGLDSARAKRSRAATSMQNRGEAEAEKRVDFDVLSTPLEGTLAFAILRRIEKSFQCGDTPGIEFLGRFIPSLHHISIPDKYGAGFVQPLLEVDSFKDSQLTFLCAQVSMRRRAFSPGPSFVSLVSEVCRSSKDGWQRWGKESKNMFLDSFGDFGSRIASHEAEECIEQLWSNCKAGQPEDMVRFLKSTKRLLSSAAAPAKSVAVLRSILLDLVAKDAFSLPVEDFVRKTKAGSVLGALAVCLLEIPVHLMDQDAFSRLDASGVLSTECSRALTLLELLRLKYYIDSDRSLRELSNIKTFLSIAVLKHSHAALLIRRLICSYCSVIPKGEGNLDIFFELLLLADRASCTVGLEWISTYTSALVQPKQNRPELSLRLFIGDVQAHMLPDAELERFVQLQVAAFPETLLTYCETSTQGFAVVVNHLLRTRERWMEMSVPDHLLLVIEEAIRYCQKEKGSAYTELVVVRMGKSNQSNEGNP